MKRVERLAEEARGQLAQRLSHVLPIATKREAAQIDCRIGQLRQRIRAVEQARRQ